ncbi:hypothetical protein [Nocardia sp. NPDC004260]
MSFKRPIPGVEDFYLVQPDGVACTEYRLDFSGRLFVTGYDSQQPSRDITHCTSHGIDHIREIHDLTGAILAHLEEHQ